MHVLAVNSFVPVCLLYDNLGKHTIHGLEHLKVCYTVNTSNVYSVESKPKEYIMLFILYCGEYEFNTNKSETKQSERANTVLMG